jgi:hypothetical protein
MEKMLATAAFVLLVLSGCSSSASLVRKDAIGGRVAIEGAYMPAMADARLLMVEHCQGRFEAVEVGDAVEFRCRNAKLAPEAAVAVADARAVAKPGL